MMVPYLPPCFTRKFNTDRYLDFSSHHPLAHKAAVTRTLLTRADRSAPSSVTETQRWISVSSSSCPFRSEFCPLTLFTAHAKSSYAHRLTGISYRTQPQTIPAQLAITLKERKTYVLSFTSWHPSKALIRHRPRPDLSMRE